jgi:hypothetical protein
MFDLEEIKNLRGHSILPPKPKPKKSFVTHQILLL